MHIFPFLFASIRLWVLDKIFIWYFSFSYQEKHYELLVEDSDDGTLFGQGTIFASGNLGYVPYWATLYRWLFGWGVLWAQYKSVYVFACSADDNSHRLRQFCILTNESLGFSTSDAYLPTWPSMATSQINQCRRHAKHAHCRQHWQGGLWGVGFVFVVVAASVAQAPHFKYAFP